MGFNHVSEQKSFVKGALFGAAVGISALGSYQYIRRILSQPRLVSKAVLSDIEDFDNLEARALFISAENLRSGIETRHLANGQHRRILHAGYRNFRESWARDFGFACFGLLALEEFEAVKDTIATYFLYQESDGRLPVKLQSMSVLTRYLHSLLGREQSTSPILTPKFITGHRTRSLDGQALLIIAAKEYFQSSQDIEFIQFNWHILRKAVRWLASSAESGNGRLLYQQAYADWADSIDRHGFGLYTNVVYWKSLKSMAYLASALDFPEDARRYEMFADDVAAAINNILWRPDLGYFSTSENLDQFSSAGNLLAAAWDLAYPEQANSILEFIRRTGLAEPVPTQVAIPPYPKHLIAIENRLGGLADYHNQAAWLWIGAWQVIAMLKYGRKDEARSLLADMARVIVRDQQVHEAYGINGQPLSSIWYHSEAPLTWNAGMVIYAFKIVEDSLKEELDFGNFPRQLTE